MLDKRAKSALSLRIFEEDITTAGQDTFQKKAKASGSTNKISEETVALEPTDNTIENDMDIAE